MKARIPADVDMPDRIFFGLTFRQISIVALDAFIVWALFVLLANRLEMWAIGVLHKTAAHAVTRVYAEQIA